MLLCGLSSGRGAWAPHRHDFLRCGAWALGIPGFCNCGVRAQRLQLLGSRATSSVAVSHGLCCSTACGIFPDQGLNPCSPCWQADSYLPCCQGSPICDILFYQLGLRHQQSLALFSCSSITPVSASILPCPASLCVQAFLVL